MQNNHIIEMENWDDVEAIAQGFNFEVALTSNGRILFSDFNKDREARITKELESWRNITQIAVWANTLAGLDVDGQCHLLDISGY